MASTSAEVAVGDRYGPSGAVVGVDLSPLVLSVQVRVMEEGGLHGDGGRRLRGGRVREPDQYEQREQDAGRARSASGTCEQSPERGSLAAYQRTGSTTPACE